MSSEVPFGQGLEVTASQYPLHRGVVVLQGFNDAGEISGRIDVPAALHRALRRFADVASAGLASKRLLAR